MKRHALAVLITLLITVSCTRFDRRWEHEALASTPNTLAGRWEGNWNSVNGHDGKLRAIIIPERAMSASSQPATQAATMPMTDSSTRLYHATFEATFWGCFTTVYNVDLTATTTANGQSFTGTKDLGKNCGGIFHYAGTAYYDHVQATYQAAKDHGNFSLNRAPLR